MGSNVRLALNALLAAAEFPALEDRLRERSIFHIFGIQAQTRNLELDALIEDPAFALVVGQWRALASHGHFVARPL